MTGSGDHLEAGTGNRVTGDLAFGASGWIVALEDFLVLRDVARELGRHVFLGEDGRHRALRLARTAVDALVGMDVELVFALVDAIDRAHVHAGPSFTPMQASVITYVMPKKYEGESSDARSLFSARCVFLLRLLIVAAAVSAPLGPSLVAQTCGSGPVALVLSGGGAKVIAHIGVLRVLDSLGVRPISSWLDMGAVIGAMYASGYSGRELDSLTHVVPLGSLFRTYAPRAPRSLGPLQPLVVWEQGAHGFALQNASVRASEVNSLLNVAMLRGNLIARGDFDALPIPFRAVATDLRDRSAVVLASGDLARAVRASIAIPLVFPPESIGTRVLADGGLSANIPIAIAHRAGAARVSCPMQPSRGGSRRPLLAALARRPAARLSLRAEGRVVAPATSPSGPWWTASASLTFRPSGSPGSSSWARRRPGLRWRILPACRTARQ